MCLIIKPSPKKTTPPSANKEERPTRYLCIAAAAIIKACVAPPHVHNRKCIHTTAVKSLLNRNERAIGV